MENWMLDHKYVVEFVFFVLILGVVWLGTRNKYNIKELKPLYRILIYTTIAAIVYMFMVLTSKFSLVGAIIIIGLPFALLSFL